MSQVCLGVVLAAGTGSRLGHRTSEIPKTLVPIAPSLTILDVILSNLSVCGVKEVVVMAGHRADQLHSRSASMADRYGQSITVSQIDTEGRNNAYTLWHARDWISQGALVVNGDTLHHPSVERALLAAARADEVALCIDDVSPLGLEGMKVAIEAGLVKTISKGIPLDSAHGEYIGVAWVGPQAAGRLIDALHETWTRHPDEYYEDGIQRAIGMGMPVRPVSAGPAPWIEVDTAADLETATRQTWPS